MQIPDGKIEGVVSSEQNRRSLSRVKYDVEGKRVIASDGRMMAFVPVEPDEGDVSGAIDPDHFQEGRKRGRKANRLIPPSMKVNEIVTFADGATSPRCSNKDESLLPFPDFDAVISDTWGKIKTQSEGYAITLNANLLIRLAAAVAPKNGAICLWVKGNQTVVIVKGEDGAYGAIMPIK